VPPTAHDIAVVLRQRLPGLPTKKLHKLLYYCQGHHLATFNQPLFAESISAWDMGPVVGALWFAEKHSAPAPSGRQLGEAELNTIGYVLSRYGALTGRDLENLTHSEDPWRRADRARRPGESARIEPEWIRGYFTSDGRAGADDEVHLDSAVVKEWLAGAADRRREPLAPDSREAIEERIAQLRARLDARD